MTSPLLHKLHPCDQVTRDEVQCTSPQDILQWRLYFADGRHPRLRDAEIIDAPEELDHEHELPDHDELPVGRGRPR